MKLADFLRPEAVRANLAGNSVRAVLSELARSVAQAWHFDELALAEALVAEGGKLDSASAGDGVAFLVCKVPGLPGMAASFGRSRRGVHLESVDGKPVRLFLALFAPDGTQTPDTAALTRALGRPEFRRALLDASDSAAIVRLFQREERRERVRREIRGWAITIAAVVAFRSFLYEAVYIPSGSMIPTLEIGDYVIVEKWAYGARLPFTESAQLVWSTPRRGDIVVLLAPPGNPHSDDLIKRVVAVGGDTVEIRDGALWLNGAPVPRTPVDGPCTYWSKTAGPWREEPCAASEERLGDHTYRTYCTPDIPCRDVEPRAVPPGTVWLAGDHRDQSADSRVFGAVPVGRIKGRAWMALASWGPDGPRWKRLFQRVTH